MAGRVLFLNRNAAKSKQILGQELSPLYRQAAKILGSGLIDRTRTLQTAFPYDIIDPIPGDAGSALNLRDLMDQRAGSILNECRLEGKKIQLLWSGGIDSTAALVSFLRVIQGSDLDYLELALSDGSIEEYPSFYDRFIRGKLAYNFVGGSLADSLNPDSLIVTGELGDQIFGSVKAAPYVDCGLVFEPWEDSLRAILNLESSVGPIDHLLLPYLEPLISKSPIPIKTGFDALWWINFTLKWQIVDLRLAVFSGHPVKAVAQNSRHFFNTLEFQQWAFQNHDQKIQKTWSSYKMPLKDYIFEFSGDADYRDWKVKMPSLKHVIREGVSGRRKRLKVVMTEDYLPRIIELNSLA